LNAVVAATAGFLAAVLWFDLMFDVQALRRPGPRPEALATTAGYYRRVTTDARPMNLLVGVVMTVMLVAIGVQIADGNEPAWVGWASLALAAPPVALAAAHTYPAAVRLGAGRDSLDVQARLARSILRDHLFCLAAIAALLAIQLTAAG
jgi:hypothetical protein